MIGESEVRRLAAGWCIDPMVADLDYALGWFLAALVNTSHPSAPLRFKGGTCLRKCYFPDYRFSEDLDFTSTRALTMGDVEAWVVRATAWTRDHDGPDFAAAPPRYEVVEDDYGSETYQVRLYVRGPLPYGGAPRSIRLDITRHERVMWPVAWRPLSHPYSDGALVGGCTVPCYALQEVLAEKVRALAGQRRYAISRDVYDIHQIVAAGVSAQDIVDGLPGKFAARGLDIVESAARLSARKSAFERDWRQRLGYLLQDNSAASFESAWDTVSLLLATIDMALNVPPADTRV